MEVRIFVSEINTNNLIQNIMTLTVQQNNELDSLKDIILNIEKNIEKSQTNLELDQELEQSDDIKKYEKSIDFGLKEIKKMVSIQAEAMKLDYNLVLDLIFDREYTLGNN
jgi:hypothetical protein